MIITFAPLKIIIIMKVKSRTHPKGMYIRIIITLKYFGSQ